MERKLTYPYDMMETAAVLLSGMTLTGIENFRRAAKLADILDSGELSAENDEMLIKKKHGEPPVNKRKLNQDKTEETEVLNEESEPEGDENDS